MSAQLVEANSRSAPRRFTDDGGAVLVEAALITPVFVFLLFGVLEFGGAFRDYLTMSNTVAAATREEAIQGNLPTADYDTMLAVQKASGAMPLSQINYVVVWKAADQTSTVPANCKSGGNYNGGNVTTPAIGGCNRYVTADIRNPSSTWACTNADPNRFYCPTARKVVLASPGPDYLGVYINITHPWVTGLFGAKVTMSDQAVTRLEPQKAV